MENDLSKIWPTLKLILKLAGNVDDFLAEFSMGLARDGAWKFAKSIANKPHKELESLIGKRDQKVAQKAGVITNPGIVVKTILKIIRICERGSVSKRIEELKN